MQQKSARFHYRILAEMHYRTRNGNETTLVMLLVHVSSGGVVEPLAIYGGGCSGFRATRNPYLARFGFWIIVITRKSFLVLFIIWNLFLYSAKVSRFVSFFLLFFFFLFFIFISTLFLTLTFAVFSVLSFSHFWLLILE